MKFDRAPLKGFFICDRERCHELADYTASTDEGYWTTRLCSKHFKSFLEAYWNDSYDVIVWDLII